MKSKIGLMGVLACALCAGAADDLTRAWNFAGSKTCGWRNMMGISDLRVTDEGLLITAANDDPAIDLSIPLQRLSDYWQVVVRMKASKDAQGPIREFSVRDSFTGEKLALKDVVFTDGKPDIPGELTLTATEIPLAFNRVGQDFPVEVFLFNPGTLPVSGATCEVSGLPAGVTVVNADAARRVITLPGWNTAAHRIVLRAERSRCTPPSRAAESRRSRSMCR